MWQEGTRVGHYVVGPQLAERHSTRIFAATHSRLGSRHVLKVVRDPTDSDSAEALLQEGQLQSTLHHTNILRCTDTLKVEGHQVLVLDRVEGTTLARWMQGRSLPLATALVVFQGIVRGALHAHSHRVVHRMLCPAKVLIDTQRPVPKIIDFAMAKRMEPEDPEQSSMSLMFPFIGVPGYTAPEQSLYAAGAEIESDLYSLGCILYELLTGQRAFPTDDPVEARERSMARRYLRVGELRPQLPIELERVVHRLLEPDPERRVRDCATLLRLLDAADTLL